MNSKVTFLGRQLVPLASLGAFVAMWGLVSLYVDPEFLPSPRRVWDEFLYLLDNPIGGTSIWAHVGYSLRRVMIAFALGVLLGLPLGLWMGWSRVCEKIVTPIFEVLRPIPPIAWIPIAILWLGVAEGSKIFICFVGAFVIMVLNSCTGMRYVDPLLDRRGQILWRQSLAAVLQRGCALMYALHLCGRAEFPIHGLDVRFGRRTGGRARRRRFHYHSGHGPQQVGHDRGGHDSDRHRRLDSGHGVPLV